MTETTDQFEREDVSVSQSQMRTESVPLSVGEAERSAELVPWPLDLAPRDGTTVRLLVDYREEASAADVADHAARKLVWPWTPLEDAEVAWTIGHNSFDNTGDDEWQIAGWCWSQDHYTQGRGKVIGWLPFHPEFAAPAANPLIADTASPAHGRSQTEDEQP